MRRLPLACFWLLTSVACSNDPAGGGGSGGGAGTDGGGPTFVGTDATRPTADSANTEMADAGGTATDNDATVSEDANGPSVDAGITDTASEDTPVTEPEDAGQKPPLGDPDIVVDPAEYTFSYLSPLPQMLTRQFTIFNGGASSLTVTGVSMKAGSSADFGLIGVPPLPKVLLPGEHTLFIARFLEKEGGAGTVVIQSDDPDSPSVEVPLGSHLKASIASPDPCIQIQPSSLGFGNVVRGEKKILGATIKNCSEKAPLKITKITRSNFFFVPLSEELQIDPMPPLPAIIPPGGTLPVAVSYAPLLAGPDIGSFIFHNDDPSEPEASLDVSGNGIQPPLEEIGLSIKVSWDADLCDVDSHFIEPGGSFFDCKTDCHFGNPAPDWGTAGDWMDDPFLDVDDVDGFGPETTNISEPQPGTYRFLIHYYADDFEDSASTDTNVTVEVFSYDQKIAEFGPQNLDQTNRNWDVFDIEWPSKVITPLGQTYMVGSGDVKTCFNFP